MGFFIRPSEGVRKLRDRSYEEIVDLIEAYGFERILEDSHMDKAFALSVLDELGFIELEMYEDDN